jgi:hypothetical protein
MSSKLPAVLPYLVHDVVDGFDCPTHQPAGVRDAVAESRPLKSELTQIVLVDKGVAFPCEGFQPEADVTELVRDVAVSLYIGPSRRVWPRPRGRHGTWRPPR